MDDKRLLCLERCGFYGRLFALCRLCFRGQGYCDDRCRSPARMAQKNIAFAPDLLPVLVGTAVDFPNLDDTYHNVFSYSKAKRFDLGRYRKDEKPTTVVFD